MSQRSDSANPICADRPAKRMDLSDTVRLLGDLLGTGGQRRRITAVVRDGRTHSRLSQGAPRRVRRRPAARLAAEVATLAPDAARGVASAFALYFDLVNVAEEDYRVQALRQRQRDQYPQPDQ